MAVESTQLANSSFEATVESVIFLDNMQLVSTTFEATEESVVSLDNPPWYLQLPFFLAVSLPFWLVSVVGNALVLVCVLRDRKLHRPSYYLVAALSLADIGYPLLGFPPMTYGAFVSSAATCDPEFKFFIMLPGSVFATASFLTLLWLTIERYCSLAIPISHRRMVTKRRALLFILSQWLFSVCFSVMPFPFSSTRRASESSTSSSSAPVTCPPFSFEFAIMVSSFGTAGLLLLSMVNVHFLILLRRRLRSGANKKGSCGMSNQVSKSISIIVVFFILCWLPLTVFTLLEAISYRREVNSLLLDAERKLFIILFTLNGAINPIVYARKNPHLGAAFGNLIWKKRNQIDTSRSSASLPLNTVAFSTERPRVTDGKSSR